MNLRFLTDKALLADTKLLVKREREVSLAVIHHLREIEKRKLFSDLGYSSLFDYAVRDLGYSEASAMRRINAARVIQDIPEIEKSIENGTLTLTNLSIATNFFKTENIKDLSAKKEILIKIENVSKRECEKALLELTTPKTLPIEPTFGINFNLSAKTMESLKELRDLLAYKRWKQDDIIRFAIEAGIEKERKRKSTPPAESPCNTRYVPVNLQRYIFKRDKSCVKCGTQHRLEIDHIVPYSLGGKTTRDNLRVLCHSCNQRARIRAKL